MRKKSYIQTYTPVYTYKQTHASQRHTYFHTHTDIHTNTHPPTRIYTGIHICLHTLTSTYNKYMHICPKTCNKDIHTHIGANTNIYKHRCPEKGTCTHIKILHRKTQI